MEEKIKTLSDLMTNKEFSEYIKESVDRVIKVQEQNKDFSHIEIKSSKELGGVFTELYIDGQRIEGVRNFKLVHHAGKIPTLHLDLNALDIAIDQDVLTFLNGYGQMIFKPEKSAEGN